MHKNLSVTDGVYGVLSELDVKEEIVAISNLKNSGSDISTEQLIEITHQLLNRLENK